ncbi:HepT-like ribonuclease domain-containing protein [Sulfuricurvum sp.]|uniref:HepT-like ribonuclease domain-containing protein n=1 Tax=Sulfuricurvum sp. TaxID=2025608 RepID=UPI0026297888|nr:HepT-like ribonuclease domain-containing protein [Sulfuricurvum sp.]MDD2781488.1 DUF86 domain-containing protein [Sulfuricurvum sp.]
MYSERALERIRVINKKIGFIENIVRNSGSIINALEDEENSRASILMHLTSIAEQFDKLLHTGELEILSNFEKQDIKGSYELRNFIAHDYEGIDLYIVENVIEGRLPVIKQGIKKILNT